MLTFQPGERVLFKLPHGLGDAVQFTIVLQHLQEAYPESKFSVLTNPGKASLFPADLVASAFDDKNQVDFSQFDTVYLPPMFEVARCYDRFPSTKPYRTLTEDFGLAPRSLPYRVQMTNEDHNLVSEYLSRLPDRPFVAIHYQGNSATPRKNLSHDVANKIVQRVLAADMTPVVLDWDGRSPLIDQTKVFCPHSQDAIWDGKGTGESSTIAALLSKAQLMIGIDSGPEHLCAATETPLVVCWTRHHPLHFFDLGGNVHHLIPKQDQRLLRPDRKIGAEYFRDNYQFTRYESLDKTLCELLDQRLKPRKEPVLPNCQCTHAGHCHLFQRLVSEKEHRICSKGDEKSENLRRNWSRELGLL